jgi:hypothetical protein
MLLPNFGVHTTQRGEKNHHLTKEKGLTHYLAVSESVKITINNDSDLGKRIREQVDQRRGKFLVF